MATWTDVGLMFINAVLWAAAAYLIGREHGMSVIVGDWIRADRIREKRESNEPSRLSRH